MTTRRFAWMAAAITASAVVASAILPMSAANAHGAPMAPGSRTYLCYQDGIWTGGDLDPRNPACQNAIAVGGKQPLWDWFGVLRSDGAGRMAGFIPDGKLCSGDNPKYVAFDAPRDDWPVTHLTSNAPWTFHYNAWAPHPGTFTTYVTKDGFDPTKPLNWADLESAPFSTWSETTPNGTGEYFWNATLPTKTGRHIIYTVWSRTDSTETFYSCSDVVFDGGKGEVTGYPNGSTPTPSLIPTGTPAPTVSPTATTPAVTPTPTTAPTPTTPVTPTSTTPVTPTSTAPVTPTSTATSGGSSSCTAQVNVQAWPGGYMGTVTVLNQGVPAQPWNVTFSVPSGVTILSGWNADVVANGNTVTAQAPAWNPTLKAGDQVSVGFVAAGPSTPPPADVRLNGVTCNSGSSSSPTTPAATTAAPAVTTPAPTPSAATTPSATTPVATTPAPTTPDATSSTPVTPVTPVSCGTGAFCDGFESQTGATPAGPWTVTTPDCSGTGTASVDTTVVHSGTKSLRIDGGVGYCNHVFVASSQDLAALGKTVFVRMYVRHSTALPVSHVTFLAMKDANDGGADLRVGGQNAALQWNRASDDATLPEQSPAGVAQSKALPTGSWQCLEVEVNGANSTAHTWLNGTAVDGLTADGTPTTDIDKQWYAKAWAPAVTNLRLGWESYGDGADTLWFDDIAIATSRIGC